MAEIIFRGSQVAEETKSGLKTATLRRRNPNYDFPSGESVMGVFPDTSDQIPLTIIQSIVGKLDDLPLAVLALDGIFQRSQAVKILNDYYGSGHGGGSEVNLEVYLAEERFNRLAPNQRQKLLNTGVLRSISNPEFAELFLPGIAYYYFLIRYPLNSYNDYLAWAKTNHLVDKKRLSTTGTRYPKETFGVVGRDDIVEMLKSRENPEEDDITYNSYRDLVLFSPNIR